MFACWLRQILDAGTGEALTVPTTVARSSNALIGSVSLGDDELRLPETGPPCKVIELPLELPVAPKGKRVQQAGRSRYPTVIMFLERLPNTSGGVCMAQEVLPHATAVEDRADTTFDHTPELEDIFPLSKTSAIMEMERPLSAQRKKMRLRVFRAWALAADVKDMDAVVAVKACGRDIGTTRVSAVGGTTSPEWMDEQ